IEGTVVDEQGKPVSGAVVVVHRYPLPPPGLEKQDSVGIATTNSEGRYLIPDRVPEGTAALGPRASWIAGAYLPVERPIQLNKGFEPAYSEQFSVRSGSTERIDLQLHTSPTFHIRGSVSPNPGTERAFVSLQRCGISTEDNMATRTTLANDGTFDAAGLI